MEQLPYIDEHSIQITATPERVWDELGSSLRAELGRALPTSLTQAWGLVPDTCQGEWRGAPRLGDALTGFTVVEADRPKRLALRGKHRFSRYELAFELDAAPSGGCMLRARTSAAFPGPLGRVYRALVIGTRGHRLLVRRLLREIAARA
jgi:hypothetical protein